MAKRRDLSAHGDSQMSARTRQMRPAVPWGIALYTRQVAWL
jgi:hypothetical protein